MGKASITIAVSSVFNGAGFEKAISSAEKLGSRVSRIEKLTAANVNSMSSDVAKLGMRWEETGRKMAESGRRIAAVGDSLTRSVTVPMVAAGVYAGKMAVDFDSALANVRKTSDLTESQLESLAASALEFSKVQPVTAETILNVEALGAQLGIAQGNLENFARVATGLDIATNMNAEQAGTELARFANIVGMAEDEYENYGSTLVAIGNNMATTESEVSQMAQRFASAGKQAGLTEAEILGLSGAMSALGIKSEMGGSALSQVFVSISKSVANGGDQLEAFAKRAGMSAEEFSAAWRDNAADAFTQLLKGINDASEAGADMNVVLAEMGFTQIRQSDIMRRMAGSIDEVTGALDLSRDAWRQNSALQAEVDQRNESMASRLQVLKNKVDAVAVTFGGPLVEAVISAVDALAPAVEAVAGAAQAFADMDESGQRSVLMWAGVVAASGPALSVFGRMKQAVGGVIGILGSATSKVAVYSDAMNSLNGANLRTYGSSKSSASALGLAANAAVKAAGGVDNYVSAWDAMIVSADRVKKAEIGIREIMREAGGSLEDATAAQLRRASALETELNLAEHAYKSNAKLVSAWGGTTAEAEKAARGIRGLDEALKEVKDGAKSGGVAAARLGDGLKEVATKSSGVGVTLGRTVTNGFKLASASVKAFVASAAPIAAVTAAVGVLGTAVMKCVEHNRALAEHERLVADATMSAGAIMAQAANGYIAAGDAIGEMKPKADETLQSLKSLNDEAVDVMTEFAVGSAELDSYVSTIDQLANKSGLTAQEQEKLKIAVEGYNRITGESVEITDAANGKIEDSSGKLIENTDQLKKNAAAWKRKAESEAYSQLATKYLKKQIEAEHELGVAQGRVAKLTEEKTQKQKEFQAAVAENDWFKAAEISSQISKLDGDINTATKEMDDLSAAAKTAGDSYSSFAIQGALASSELAESVKANIRSLPPEFQAFALDLATNLDSSGKSVGTFEQNLAAMGLSIADVKAIGEQNFAALYEACNGNVELMTWAIQNYNNVPVIDKSGTVHVDDAQLIDAQGNVYTWNDGKLVNKSGKVAMDDIELIDAQGRVYKWNDGKVVSKEATTDIESDSVEEANRREDERNKKKVKDKKAETDIDSSSTQRDIDRTRKRKNNPPENQTASTTINRYENTYKSTKTKSAAGGVFLHAAGGVARHADGFILNRATDITRHIAGEDGAEAIIPLTNRRYTRPFAQTVAEETVAAMGRGGGDSYTVVINGSQSGGMSPAVRDAVRVIVDEYRDTMRMGVAI